MTQNVSADRKLLSTAEACRISGLGRQYIERLLRQGRLAGIKPAHDWLVYEDSLHAFLSQPRKRGPKGSRKQLSADNLTVSSGNTDPSQQNKKSLERGEVVTDGKKEPLRDDSMTSS